MFSLKGKNIYFFNHWSESQELFGINAY